MKLIYEETGVVAKIGDMIKYKDNFYRVKDIIFPKDALDKGRVILFPITAYRKDFKASYYPEDIGAKFITDTE